LLDIATISKQQVVGYYAIGLFDSHLKVYNTDNIDNVTLSKTNSEYELVSLLISAVSFFSSQKVTGLV